MKNRYLFSIGVVTVLTGLSVVAFSKASAEQILEQRVLSESAVNIEWETTTEPMQTAEEIVPMERPEKSLYQSHIVDMDLDAEDRYFLAKIAMAEASTEDTKGKALVMLVVLNRVQSDNFPSTIEEVIYQSGQFSPISNGRFDGVEPDADCWAALDLIMQDKWDESHGATYFESKSESTWHSENLTFLFQHGKHYFYTDREEDGD